MPTAPALNLYTISMAASAIGTTRDKVWYAIRRGFWRPRYLLGQSYVLDDKDVAELREALARDKVIGGRQPRGRFLRDAGIRNERETGGPTPGLRSPKTR